MSEMRQGVPAFVKGMIQGGEKLDEVLQAVYGGTPRRVPRWHRRMGGGSLRAAAMTSRRRK